MSLFDPHGRRINYLRLSVTDRCNLRCSYCMPAAGVEKQEHAAILRYEELYEIARTAVGLGIEKIRVTGGEPLVRKGIVEFLGDLAEIPGLKELVLTTNGVLLPQLAPGLRLAGVQRLNISLDSLNPETFARITGRNDHRAVLAGIALAEEIGFPLKLNVVVMRGINDHEIEDFAALTLERPLCVRFIEYMPTIKAPGWQELVVPGEEILARIARRHPLAALTRKGPAGPAREFRIPGAAGTIGTITPLSGHFCGDCNRIRVTATGQARSCLFSNRELDLRPVLALRTPLALDVALRQLVQEKPAMHRLTTEVAEHTPFTMAAIGG